MLKRFYPDELWREECELAFAWQHRRDRKALKRLVERFQPLIHSIAGERFRVSQLDKGVKTTNTKMAEKNPELAGHYHDLLQAGNVGLMEAITLYDGRNRFATYARHWIFKRMAEYVRWNWNVVVMPEPSGWKVAKEDQIPPTIPNENLNPFENPYSPDKKAKHSRHATISTPREGDSASRAPEEWIAGRLHAGSTDAYEGFSGAGHFEPTEYQFRAHETMDAQARAVEMETLSASLDARASRLTPRKFQIVRARFPWAVDVKNAPDREEEFGEYLRGHQICFPKKHTRWVIGIALGISDEWVRRIEDEALAEIRRSKLVVTWTHSQWVKIFEECWFDEARHSGLLLDEQRRPGADVRRLHLEARKSNWQPPDLPRGPDRYGFLLDRLVEAIAKKLKQERKKRWLPTFLYEEEIRKGKLRPRAEYLKVRRAYLSRKRRAG